MRIDLHTHTKKCKTGESETRKISPEEFVAKMKENDVQVCAITNHNCFDLEEYERISTISPELLIFPGIELDVEKNGNISHIILVCSPDKLKDFHETFDNDPNRNYDTFCLCYDDFLKKVREFNKNEIIIIPHFADKDRAIGKDFEDSPKKDLNDYVVILETAKLHTMGMVNSHGHLSLIGSDIQDWNKYSKEYLPEIKFRIDSFGKFYELTSDPSTFVKTALGDSEKSNIIVDNQGNHSLQIFNDINVVFGEKGSGKTVLLKDYIKPYYHSVGNNVLLHEGKDYQSEYDTIVDRLTRQVEIDEDRIRFISNLFDQIIKYKEPDPKNFVKESLNYWNGKQKSKNRTLLKKADTSYTNVIYETFDNIYQKYSLDSKVVQKVKGINNKLDRNTIDELSLKNELEKLSKDLVDDMKRQYKEVFISNNIDSFLNNLKQSAQKNSGSKSKQSSFGFASFVSQRLKRLICNKEILEEFENIKQHHKQKLGILPNKGEAIFNTSIVVLSRHDKHEKDSVFDRKRIVLNRDIMKKLEDFTTANFGNINEYFTHAEAEVKGEIFANDVIKKSNRISIEGNDNYTPSEGEKAILSISGILEDRNYDCYLFDEIERGLGNKYVTDYIIPQLKALRDAGKTIVISTHNANLAINTLPSQCIYCDYKNCDDEIYYTGNMYSDELIGISSGRKQSWECNALVHLEGSEEMFSRRRNIYGI